MATALPRSCHCHFFSAESRTSVDNEHRVYGDWNVLSCRGSTRQIFSQKFWVRSESTSIGLSKNLSFIVQICDTLWFTPRVNSWNKYGSLKKWFIFNCSLFSDMHIVKGGWRCVILWSFNLPTADLLIFSLKFDQSYPFTQMTQKVCQKSAI